MRVAIVMMMVFAGIYVQAQQPGWQSSELDFCGIEAVLKRGNPFDRGLVTNTPNALTAERFVEVPLSNLNEVEFTNAYYSAFRYIRLPAIQAEAAAVAGDRERFLANIEIVASILKGSADEKSMCFHFAFSGNMLEVENLLARIVCDRREKTVKVSAEGVRRILPESVTLSTVRVLDENVLVHNEPYASGSDLSHNMAVTFRNMLIVGAAIEEHLRKSGSLPGKLGELSGIREKELLDAYGAPLEYRTKGSDWELFSPGWAKYDKSLEDVEFGLGVPVIGTISGPRSDSVWFSSLFSKKRAELYEKGIVNEGTKFQCKLAPHTIIRGVRD